jgi:AbrB family looped-hinge helix DNA binding protein
MLCIKHLLEPAMSTVTLSSKGQIALPVELRNRLGLATGSRLEITEEAGGLLLKPVHTIAPVALEGLSGMVKAQATGKPRSLDDFDAASLLAHRDRSQP